MKVNMLQELVLHLDVSAPGKSDSCKEGIHKITKIFRFLITFIFSHRAVEIKR
jgi:hypothetical protein